MSFSSTRSSELPKGSIQRVVLASSSPFRKKLLSSTGLEFTTQTAAVDEYALVGATPTETCFLRAKAKAEALALIAPGDLVIGCDQILALDGKSFDKAKDSEEAAARLKLFSGRTHYLINQITLTYHNHVLGEGQEGPQILTSFEVTVPMQMRSLSHDEITAYVATGEWQGCVGCYQFENRGINLFDAVSGQPVAEGAFIDHSAVMGLPLVPLLAELRRLGVNALTNPRGPW